MSIFKFLWSLFRRNKVIATPVNDGFVPEPPPVGAWMFGDDNWKKLKPLVPDGNWLPYIFLNESQAKRSRDTFSCVTFAVLNVIELIVYRKYGIKLNLSDRFTAKMSGTVPGRGNTFNNVLESSRKDGHVDEDKWPFTDDMIVPDEFFAEIPAAIKALGQEFLKEWSVAYWHVPRSEFNEGLKVSPLMIAVHAWWLQNGLYISPDDRPQNHATTLIHPDLSVFDSYDPFIKRLHTSHKIYNYGVVMDVTKRSGSTDGAKIYERVKGRAILLVEQTGDHVAGEAYRVYDDYLQKIKFDISDEKIAKVIQESLREKRVFIGINGKNFLALKEYIGSKYGAVRIEEASKSLDLKEIFEFKGK